MDSVGPRDFVSKIGTGDAEDEFEEEEEEQWIELEGLWELGGLEKLFLRSSVACAPVKEKKSQVELDVETFRCRCVLLFCFGRQIILRD